MGSLPFLVPLHLRPITSFYGEWLAALLMLILFAVLTVARRGRTLRLPWMLFLPAIFLAVIGLQLAVGRVYFPQQALIYSAYILLAAVAMITGATASDEIGATPASIALAGGFAVGALAQAAICALQIQDVVLQGWATPLERGHRVYGNLAQFNLLADYFWLGVVSVWLLHSRGVIRIGTATIATVAILATVPLTGSRSALLYPLAVGAVGAVGLLVLRRSRSNHHSKRLCKALVLIAPLALILAVGVTALTSRFQPDGGNVTGRFIEGVASPASGSIRVALLRTGLAAALASPWLGGGVGAVPLQSLEHAPRDATTMAFGAAEHFHSLPINWAAEFGFPATLAALLLCLRLAYLLCSGTPDADRYWTLGMFAIVGVHSMLEYPLWHAFFIVPVGLLAGMSTLGGSDLRLRPAMMLALGASILLGANLLDQLRVDHNGLARVSHVVPSGPNAQAIWRGHLDELLLVHRTSLFSPYVAGMLVVAFDLDRQSLSEKSTLCESAIRFSPAPEVLFKCAMNDVLAGAEERARRRMRLAVAAYPAEARAWHQRLAEAAIDLPELKRLE